jgi:hypothetical protein
MCLHVIQLDVNTVSNTKPPVSVFGCNEGCVDKNISLIESVETKCQRILICILVLPNPNMYNGIQICILGQVSSPNIHIRIGQSLIPIYKLI